MDNNCVHFHTEIFIVVLFYQTENPKYHVKRSAVFRALLAADMKERNSGRIELKQIKLATGRELLYYLYNGLLKEEGSDLLGLLALADQYDMAELKHLCAEGLAARLTDDNCLEELNMAMAKLYNTPLLKAAALDYITVNAGRLVQQKTTGSTST